MDPLTMSDGEIYAEFRDIICNGFTEAEAIAAEYDATSAAAKQLDFAEWLRSAPTPAEVDAEMRSHS
jgi:transposase